MLETTNHWMNIFVFFILRLLCYFAVEGGVSTLLRACGFILFCNTSKSSVLDFKVFNMLSVRTYYVSLYFFFYIVQKKRVILLLT